MVAQGGMALGAYDLMESTVQEGMVTRENLTSSTLEIKMAASILAFMLSGPYLTLFAAVLLAIAIYFQRAVSRCYEFKLVTRWHISVIFALLTTPTIIYLISAVFCGALDQLPWVPLIFGVFLIASVPLIKVNAYRTNLIFGMLATLFQLCAFFLALTAGSIPAVTLSTLGSMDSGGRHSCR